MKILLLHSDEFAYEVKKKAISSAEEVDKKPVKIDNALVVMMAVEKSDEENPEATVKRTIEEVNKVANELKVQNVVCYPWVHLTSSPGRPDYALKVLREVEDGLNKTNKYKNVIRAPFGWYKGFMIKVKGHPLSELSREFTSSDDKPAALEIESAAIKAEDESSHEFFVYTSDGKRVPYKEFNFDKKSDLYTFFKYETEKRRSSDKPPEHVELMQRLELVDYEPASDAGNMRWYPKGWLMKRLIETHVTNTLVEKGAYCVETPIMYDFKHPALASYMNRFPARQYTVKSGTDQYFLRFAACFGQFMIASDATISYRQLPLKLFEMTHYSFRREQRGELAALRRLRTFSMPDQHTVVADMDMAKSEFREQYETCVQMMNDFELEYEAVFRFQTDFYETNKTWIHEMITLIKKPVMLELFDKRYAYFVSKFEFNIVDSQGKAAALSTVQIDVENAERFDITYFGEDGQKHQPLILHASMSGAVERVIYGILERNAIRIKKGEKSKFPFWLAPCQIRILPVTEKQLEYAVKLTDEILTSGIRAEIDDRGDRVGKMIRDAERNWSSYTLVIGDKEVESGEIQLKARDGTILNMNVSELVPFLLDKNGKYIKQKLPMSKFLSKRPIFFSSS